MDFYMNDEPVIIMHVPKPTPAATAWCGFENRCSRYGRYFDETSFPHIDLEHGEASTELLKG